MAGDITVEAVRTALGLNQLRAEVAGWNIVNASAAGAPVFTIERRATDAWLAVVADARSGAPGAAAATIVHERYDVARPPLDELVTEAVTAGLAYQALTESLGRHLGLMRLAISGRY